MIVGIGTDIVCIERIQESFSRLGEPFARRILTDAEMDVFNDRLGKSAARGVQFLANRFAAKEAFAKACGTGIRDIVVWQNMQVLNDEQGKPVIGLRDALERYACEHGWRVHVSISDESEHAVAFVIIEQ